MYAVILFFSFLIYYKLCLVGFGILLKNEYMDNTNVYLSLIRDSLTSLSSSGPFLYIAINV